jgi:tRNA (guanine6-N2)-methyltransferase
LSDIIEFCSSIPFSDWFDAGQPFAVRGKRDGAHSFTSMDLARDVGSAVVAHFQQKAGRRIPVNLDDPQIELFAVLRDNRFALYLNTSGRSLDYRYQRPFQHFAPLKPSIAAGLLRLSGYEACGNLLDPMAGGGTILIEALLKALDIPPGLFRDPDDYLFRHLHFIPRNIAREETERIKTAAAQSMLYANSTALPGTGPNPDTDTDNDTDTAYMPGKAGSLPNGSSRPEAHHKRLPRVTGADRFQKNVDGMRKNAQFFGFEKLMTIRQGLAETLSYIEPGEFDCIATNPPFGMRIGSTRLTEQLYRNFARACSEKKIREVTALTPLKRTWIRSFMENGYAITHSRIVHFGNLHVTFLKAELQ